MKKVLGIIAAQAEKK